MKPSFRRGLVCAGLLALALSVHATPPVNPAEAPALVIQTLAGKTFDLAQQRGKWVIVNFWATWCSPCIAEMPAISRFVASHKDVVAIGLAWDRSPRKDIIEFAKKHPVGYPLALVDMDHPPAQLEAPQVLPTTWLVAPDGHVAERFIAPVDEKSLERAIAASGPKSGAH